MTYSDDGRAEEFAFGEGVSNRPLPVAKMRKPSLDDLRHPNETTDQAKRRFQDISKRNINALLDWRPASAAVIDVDARWLKRLQEEGLGYASKASRTRLERLAFFFGYGEYMHLWRDDLLEQMGLPGPTVKQVETRQHSRYWKQADKLLHLLDTGEFEHLAKLIDHLFELEEFRFAKSLEGPISTPTGKSMSDFVKKKASKK